MKPPALGLGRNEIRINIKVPKEFKQLKEVQERVLEATIDMVIEAKSVWETEAGQKLNTTRERYIKALSVETDYVGGSYIELGKDDKLVKMLETGARPYDLKPGLLRPGTKKLRWTKDGVPFRTVKLDPAHRKGPAEYVTVSGNTPEQDWWHPGFEGMHLRTEVYRALRDDIIPKHVNQIVKEINFGKK